MVRPRFFSHPAFARRSRVNQMRASTEEDLKFQREESEDTIQSSLSLEDDLNEADHAVAKALAALARNSRPAPLPCSLPRPVGPPNICHCCVRASPHAVCLKPSPSLNCQRCTRMRQACPDVGLLHYHSR